jgi:hypothetical protein
MISTIGTEACVAHRRPGHVMKYWDIVRRRVHCGVCNSLKEAKHSIQLNGLPPLVGQTGRMEAKHLVEVVSTHLDHHKLEHMAGCAHRHGLHLARPQRSERPLHQTHQTLHPTHQVGVVECGWSGSTHWEDGLTCPATSHHPPCSFWDH